MSEQPTLFVVDPRLGERQRLVLEELREQRGLTDVEAGALVHARRGKHERNETCGWCGQEGRDVLSSLRGHGLVVRRKTGVWEPKGGARRAVVDGQTDEIPY